MNDVSGTDVVSLAWWVTISIQRKFALGGGRILFISAPGCYIIYVFIVILGSLLIVTIYIIMVIKR
jgi:hypothetical protein